MKQSRIVERVIESILTRQIRPGERLGEQELADLFGVSRTLVREALIKLQARGFVAVRPRSGWYVAEPSFDEALEIAKEDKGYHLDTELGADDWKALVAKELKGAKLKNVFCSHRTPTSSRRSTAGS